MEPQLESLESFEVTIDGRHDDDLDHNVGGVTFAARTLRTLAPNVECPSLSPDGTRVAFKQAIDNDPRKGWRLSVLRLADLSVTQLDETRSIDDQAAWLSDGAVAYTVRDSAGTPSVWWVPADGSGPPRKLRDDAESPSALGN